ncbi:CLUMA_CG009348, isoform A [Clunio marinus]|uniref:CLUMA_CG009348, isoform A n=1 Tax=Clunio marinus TaxID=568069 RepID=A0A1J1IAC2_9DIPT|nr:CLUMA_CG009348, isoform A [Clunio marinus]
MINSVLQVHFSLDGTGSDFMCSKCENILNDSHQSKFKINDKLKCYEKFSNKKVDNVRIELSVPIHYNFIKVEDELNISTEMELVSPMNEVKEESSEDESLKDHDEVKNEEENELENQDQSNPQFILCDAGGKVFKNDHSVKRHQCDICGLTATCKFNISSHMNTHKEFRTKDFQCQICGNSYFNKNVLRYHILKNHEKPKHLTCSLCSRTFRTEEGLKNHKSRPHRLPCEVCGKMILNNELKRHLKIVHFKIKPYQCDNCGKKFSRKQPLIKHLNTHKVYRTKDFHCQICGNSYFRKNGLERHILIKHERLKHLTCSICESSFYLKKSLRFHILKNHERSELITCSLCGKTFKSEEGLRNHKLNLHRLPCNVCGKMISKENLKRHLNTIHLNIKPYQCDICGKKFSSKSEIAHHMIKHIGLEHRTRDYQCDLCEASFFDKSGLQTHTLYVHERQQHHYCSLCNRTFRTEQGFKNHKLRPHRSPCEICGKSFRNDLLKHHLNMVHFNIKPYQCDICGKKFCKDYLPRHMDTHIGLEHRTKDFHCQICGNSYFDKHGIERHILTIHEKPKHLTCLLCGKTSRNKEDLKNHKLRPCRLPCKICGKFIPTKSLKKHLNKVHYNNKPYQCDICGKKFCKISLAGHMITHIDLEHRTKDFHCYICENSFFNKKNLQTHILNVHEKPKHLTCSLCGRFFNTKESLKNHKLIPHRLPCDICGKRFVSKRSLLLHQNMHEERKFVCDFPGCQKKLKTKCNLKKHILIVHKKSMSHVLLKMDANTQEEEKIP